MRLSALHEERRTLVTIEEARGESDIMMSWMKTKIKEEYQQMKQLCVQLQYICPPARYTAWT